MTWRKVEAGQILLAGMLILSACESEPKQDDRDHAPPEARPSEASQLTKGDQLPDPPSAPPPPPSIIETIKEAPDRGSSFAVHMVKGIADPREALFAYVISEYRRSSHFGSRTICLTDAPDDLVAKLDQRFEEVESEAGCGWHDGAVIHKATGEEAVFVHARVDCSWGSCAAEGGATYGNVGGEGHGYRMRRKGSGWTLQQTGMSWIS